MAKGLTPKSSSGSGGSRNQFRQTTIARIANFGKWKIQFERAELG